MKCMLQMLIKLIIKQVMVIFDFEKCLPIIGSLPLHDWKPILHVFHFGLTRLQSNTDLLVTCK